VRSAAGAAIPSVLAGLLVMIEGCAHQPPRFDPGARRTCLVLSVGGPSGVAHIGAIQAIQAARIPIQCVVGNSMGALVGALYASAPSVDPDVRFRQLTELYGEETKNDVNGSVIASFEGIFSEQWAIESVGPVSYDRFKRTLDRFFGSARIESLAVPFATAYVEGTATGVAIQPVRGGVLSEEVARSIANPLIFPDLRIERGRPLDPGADRLLATPLDDACAMFPRANLLLINVTDQPAVITARTNCPVLEVQVRPPPRENLAQAFQPGPVHDRLVEAGRVATRAALARL
jgi:predicted acylesterase/phospholipase RssA